MHRLTGFIWLAYVDPTIGGLLFQVLGAVFAAISGALFFFSRQVKSGFARVRRFFSGRLSRS